MDISNTHQPSKHSPLLSHSILIFVLASSFYLYEYVLQVSPSVMTTSLMRSLHIGAAGLGVVSSFYFYSYAPMQLPAGILFDRYGPRRLITLALVICTIGTSFFAIAHTATLASIGRLLIGFGSAFSFVGVLVLVSRWFPPQYFALLVGITQLMSSIGAICGQIPISFLINYLGWRSSSLILATLGLLLAIAIWNLVRDRPNMMTQTKKVSRQKKVFLKEIKQFSQICTKAQTWWIALYACSIWAPVTVFAALWGIPFLMRVYNIDRISASQLCTMMWIGIGVGSPLLGWWSDIIKNRCLPIFVSALIGFIAAFFALYIGNIPKFFMGIALFAMGVAAAGQSISFAIVKESNTTDYIGTACGFNNFAVLLGGALFQPLVGYLLQLHWHHTYLHGTPIYSITAYYHSLWVIPFCFLVAMIASRFFIKETHAWRKELPPSIANTCPTK